MAQMSQELRDLIERNSAIQEMAQSRGWGMLVDYMRAQMEARQRWVLLGHAESYEEYRRVSGWLQGVTDMITAPEALAEQVAREETKERETNG